MSAPCPTPAPLACPPGWTHPGGDPFCCASPVGEPAVVFCASYACIPDTEPVPTISGWGLAALVVFLALVGVRRLR